MKPFYRFISIVIKEKGGEIIIILNENPLENIKHTQNINLVIKGETVYTQESFLNKFLKKKLL